MRLTLAVCCVVAWGEVAYAEGKHFDVRGVGATSCGKYAEMYRMNPRNADDLYISWAQGYISGVNSGMDAYFDLGSKTSDEMLRFLRKYCDDHPLKNFHEAVEELFEIASAHQAQGPYPCAEVARRLRFTRMVLE